MQYSVTDRPDYMLTNPKAHRIFPKESDRDELKA